jgi:signal transduction histidine kinase
MLAMSKPEDPRGARSRFRRCAATPWLAWPRDECRAGQTIHRVPTTFFSRAPGAHDEPPDWLLGLGYVLAFLLLDWVSFIRPFQGLNITPWNPQPALAIALLMRRPGWLWLVWLSLVTAELAVRGIPSHWFVTLMATAALALCYAALARAARVRLDKPLVLATRRDLIWFTVIAIGGALLSGTVYVATFAVAGVGPSGPIVGAIARYWVGDAVGLVVTLPMLLMLMNAPRRASLLATAPRRDGWLIAALIGVLLLVVFGWPGSDQFKFFYLLFLPVVWASARLGLPGAVLAAALTQVGLIIAVQSAPDPDLSVFELQMLLTAVTMTGLVLGVAVDERERAAAELKGSLRLAAAGQMAAALAHELSQPLTALSSYAQASRLLVASPDIGDAERLERLADVSSRMAADALRASDVVKRLRDFFRTGSTQLQLASMPALLNQAVEAAARRAEVLGIRVRCEAADDLPDVLMDPVQIAVVLRNLLANALEAAAEGGGLAEVRLRLGERGGALLVEVQDSGPGLTEARLQTLFEPGTSDKPGGMGLGLSICRAIVEAHGGTLWAEAGPSGHFCFTLPIDHGTTDGSPHAP